MARIHLHLQEGFKTEPVTVHAGDAVVYDRPDVTTNLASSVADIVTFDAAPGSTVTITVPDLGLDAAPKVPADQVGDLYVVASVSRDRERLDVKTTTEQPLYM